MLYLLNNWLELLSSLIQNKSFDWLVPGRACLSLRKLATLLDEHLRAILSKDVRFRELVFFVDLIHVDLQKTFNLFTHSKRSKCLLSCCTTFQAIEISLQIFDWFQDLRSVLHGFFYRLCFALFEVKREMSVEMPLKVLTHLS
jgi:hypothetical protein